MHVLIVHDTTIPKTAYGGTERIMWWLGRHLVKLGHKVTYLVRKGSSCPFADVLYLSTRSLQEQIPDEIDIVHLFMQPDEQLIQPYLVTNQGNVPDENKHQSLDRNTVFVSENHAVRHQAECFVYNGIDPVDYGNLKLSHKRSYFHFLAKGSWKAKNLSGAIDLALNCKEKIHVLGGSWFHVPNKPWYAFNNNIVFHGNVRDSEKIPVLNFSRGLLFPVLWNEPFGIAMIESLLLGCPVFGTPVGSLPELVVPDVGYLSLSISELVDAMNHSEFSVQNCQDYVLDQFTSDHMTTNYLLLYEKVISGKHLNPHPPSAKEDNDGNCPDRLLP